MDTPVTVRPFEREDYDAAIDLWKNTPGIGLNSSDSREQIGAFLLRNPEFSQVAFQGDRLVGAVLCGHDGRRGYLHHLAVAETHRGQGVSRQLTDAVLDRLKAAGIEKCHLFILRDNPGGLAYWRHNGWVFREDLQLASRPLP